MFLSNWLNQFGKVKKWPIDTQVLHGNIVQISDNSKVVECLQQGGVCVARVMLGCWHYVLLTGIDSEYVYVFDPYYRKKTFNEKGILIVTDKPTQMNRKIKHEVLNRVGKENYALGALEERECILLYNNDTRKTYDSIEYMI